MHSLTVTADTALKHSNFPLTASYQLQGGVKGGLAHGPHSHTSKDRDAQSGQFAKRLTENG